MRSRYDHLELTPLDVDVLRGLSARDTRWVELDRATRDAGWDPNSPADRTRVLASLAYLRRRRLVVANRAALRGRTAYALTELGAAELAARDQMRLVA